jgi:predicted CXXCH cytochrome family protein
MPQMPSDPETPMPETPGSPNSNGGSTLTWIACLAFSVGLFFILNRNPPARPGPKPAPMPVTAPVTDPSPLPPTAPPKEPRFIRAEKFPNEYDPARLIKYWWDKPPADIVATRVDTGPLSNIHRDAYAGAESCQKCHPDNFKNWSDHPHHKMNALATAKTVQGDFSGKATLDYKGGMGRFFMEDGHYKMSLERDGIRWKYRINRTIGSRFFQYYAGVAEEIAGIEPNESDVRRTLDHVLPFGYWMPESEWVPVVHVLRSENRDDNEIDPFDSWKVVRYDRSCSDCHTTWTFADWIHKGAGTDLFTRFTPRPIDLHLGGVLQTSHPDRYDPARPLASYSYEDMERLLFDEKLHPRPAERVALGIECETCHLGSAEHARSSTAEKTERRPEFFPVDPAFHSQAKNVAELTGRTPENVNFICARCHSGTRPTYANGTHTWNSTEFADSSAGHCYSPADAKNRNMEFLTCVSCHDPHVPTGPKWTRTPAQDDQSCVRCHKQFSTPAAQAAHSHHVADTEGARCMNCHMPKINEGLEEIVRTHRIQSPVDQALVEANQPNACNLCHLDKSIDWTLKHVRDWYGDRHRFDEAKISANYPDRSAPVGPGWLKSPHAGTRLVAGSMLARTQPGPYIDALLDLLTVDEHLINRQFVQRELRRSLDFDLKAEGYQFYNSRTEREQKIALLRPKLRKLAEAK